MTISAADIRLVQQSFDRLRADFDTHSTFFYEALFCRAPELRRYFRDDLEGQGMKFMTTLGVIVQKLEDESQIAEHYMGLGRLHAALGIHVADFAPMEEALIDTLRNALGEGFTPELDAAWRRAYAVVSGNMIQRGGIDG